MITSTILYAQMKKWVAKDGDKPALKHLYFDGQKAYATNSHRLAIVRNFPVTEAHFEDAKGYVANIDAELPGYEKVLVQEKDSYWRHEIKFDVTPSLEFILPWKAAFDFMATATKWSRYRECVLQKRGTRLYAYCVGDNIWLKSKITLLEQLSPQGDWEAGFNSQYLLDAVEFLKATEPRELKIYIDKNAERLTFETEDLILLLSVLRIRRHDGSTEPDMLGTVRYLEHETRLLDSEYATPGIKTTDADFLN